MAVHRTAVAGDGGLRIWVMQLFSSAVGTCAYRAAFIGGHLPRGQRYDQRRRGPRTPLSSIRLGIECWCARAVEEPISSRGPGPPPPPESEVPAYRGALPQRILLRSVSSGGPCLRAVVELGLLTENERMTVAAHRLGGSVAFPDDPELWMPEPSITTLMPAVPSHRGILIKFLQLRQAGIHLHRGLRGRVLGQEHDPEARRAPSLFSAPRPRGTPLSEGWPWAAGSGLGRRGHSLEHPC